MYYSQKELKRIGLEVSGIVHILCQQPRRAEGGERGMENLTKELT